MHNQCMPWTTDPEVRAAWQAQVDEAAASPWRARELVQRERELFPRFAAIYQRLRTSPRRVRRVLQRKWACSLAAVALLLTLQSPPSWAANFTAGTAAELIAAITTGNGNGEANTITLTADITLTDVNNSGYFGTNGLPVITSEITITGNGHTIQRQSGAPHFRLLEVSSTGDLTLEDTTLSGGASYYNNGGGIFNDHGSLTLSNSTVSGNSASAAEGGGILDFYGRVTLTNSTVSGNSAGLGGGILDFYGSLTLSNSTVSGNSASEGGGIVGWGGSLTLSNSTVSGNSAAPPAYASCCARGGGIVSYGFGSLTLSNSTVSGNSALGGGGILGWGPSLTLSNSTVSGNSAAFVGGGILAYGGGSLTLTNSTVSGNSTGYGGGGILTAASLTLTNSTVTGNSAAGGYGGGGIMTTGSLTLSHSLVSGNTGSPGAEVFNYQSSTTVTAADNLLGHSGVTTAQAIDGFTPDASNILATSDGSDPTALAGILDPILQNNGGPTLTHNLVSGSPAVDAIPVADCPPPATDQRGVSRPQGTSCDIGAVEKVVDTVSALSPAHLWIGLRNSDDQGTRFDLKVDVLRNGSPVASGLTRCITGVTRSPTLAKEALVAVDPFTAVPLNSGDVLALKVSTRIGTNPDDTKCSGHNSAVGLRLYYDAASRASHLGATITPDSSEDLYLDSNGSACSSIESTGGYDADAGDDRADRHKRKVQRFGER